ncbi:MAG: hypothetical protein ACJ8F7_15780 [Gemmataceae bacterium]
MSTCGRALWLILILALALGTRLSCLNVGLQQDELGPLYAVAQRTDSGDETPSRADALRPVPSWRDVRARSALPYGVVNPVPLYHYLLYAVVQVLPIAEWSLRLPSLLAGLATVLAMSRLGRKMVGIEFGLIAAALTAVEPMQVTVSVLARPYAFANLACVISFIALLDILYGSRRQVILGIFTYGIAVALIGYFNPVLLLVTVAQMSFIAVWWWMPTPGVARQVLRPVAFVAGAGLGALLFLPELGCFREIQHFAGTHRKYLDLMIIPRPYILVPFLHNLTLLVALFARSSTRTVAGMWLPPGETQLRQAEPRNPQMVRLAWYWLLAPQAAAILVAIFAAKSSMISRYLTYVNLGGVLVLALGIVRVKAPAVRIAMTAMVAGMMALWGSTILGRGLGLETPNYPRQLVQRLDQFEQAGRWRSGDAVVLRGAFLEADFVPDLLPAATEKEVEGVIASPLTTLYVPETRKPLVVLSVSNRWGDKVLSGPQSAAYQPERFYTPALAEKLGGYKRLWLCDGLWKRQDYMNAFLLWLANSLQAELRVTVDAGSAEQVFAVTPGMDPDNLSVKPHEDSPLLPATITLIEILRP